ncbi:MAG: hypothetical protein JWM47_4536 [Acidimicrobiales bacterium]|nr:hypothetical protein [Acidimicrobiales bacterium]
MTRIEIDLVGGDAAVRNLTIVGQRMVHASPAFVEIKKVLEEGEKRYFDRLRGKYVKTGDTLRALTQENANGAIREIHSDGAGLTFGTSIWYAHFLKKPGGKKSAVLVLEPKARRQSKEILLDYILGRSA